MTSAAPARPTGDRNRIGDPIKLSHCNLLVRDQDEALAFYRDVIGLEVALDLPMGEGRWLTMVAPGGDGPQIILESPVPSQEGSWDAVLGLMATTVVNTLIFEVDDCDAAFDRVRAAGGEPAQPPTDQPYGMRDCSFRDPSGNQVRFSQPLGG